MIGTVRVVRDERLGAEVTAIIGGGQAIALDDVDDFNEDGGTMLLADASTRAYETADYDGNTLSGAVGDSAFASGVFVGDWIAPWSFDHEDTERVAEVDTGDGEPLLAIVPHSLRALLKPGTREPGEEEKVEVWEPDVGQAEVRNVLGRIAASIEFGGGAGNGTSLLAYKDYIELAERSADPNTNPPTGAVRVYSKVVAGTSKLYAQDDAGGVHALW